MFDIDTRLENDRVIADGVMMDRRLRVTSVPLIGATMPGTWGDQTIASLVLLMMVRGRTTSCRVSVLQFANRCDRGINTEDLSDDDAYWNVGLIRDRVEMASSSSRSQL